MKTYNLQLRNIIRTSKGRTYTVGLTTILIIVLLIFFAVLPAYRSITDQIKNNEAKQKYLEDLKNKRDDMDYLLTLYEENEEYIEIFNSYIKDQPVDDIINANLEKLAGENSIQLSGIGFGKTGSAESTAITSQGSVNSRYIPISINIRGSFSNIEKFVSSLEEFPILIKVVNVSYTNSDQTSGDSKAEPGIFKASIGGGYFIFSNIKANE